LDFITNRTIEITERALDGLAQRHRVLSANVANAQTPGFKRSDVTFEDQLQKIVEVENLKEIAKLSNSTMTNGQLKTADPTLQSLVFSDEPSIDAILKHNSFAAYQPRIVSDESSEITEDGNNVNIEKEMTEVMKNGTKYTVLSDLEGKMFKKIGEVIKGAV